ncbi:unnamed protein product [Arabidopsis arenosa]|uniref:Cytochrome P450 n=1 Tax=Arabidopsis arenosa TaxID=38785 RepID=A0A8S2ASX2_ARAAE|nr:unnamed protein product [Arabidopsis arenosa]
METVSSNFSLSQILNIEEPYSSVMLGVAALLAVVCYFWIQGKSKSKNGPPLPPGPWPLPIVGNLPFLNSEILHTQFQALTLKHGPLMKIHLGSKLAIVVSSPDMAREVLKTHDITFANHDLPEVGKINTYGGEDILWSPYGTHWRRLRKLCVMKMFTTPTLEASYSTRREETRQTVVYMSEMAREGSPVNLGEQIFLSIFNVVTRMMWGATVEGDERTSLGNELKTLISDISDIEGIQNYSDFFPLFSRFDFQGLVKQMKGHVKKLDLLFDRVMESHVKMVGKKSEEEEDFLQYLLRVKDDDEKAPLSMTHVKSLLMDMVLGGRRICAAINMAERLVLFNIASLLHSFDWKAPQGQKFEVEEKFGLVLKLKSPLVAIPVPRLSDPKLYTA